MHNAKVQMNKLVGWLIESISADEENAGYGSPTDLGSVPSKIEYLSFLNKCVTVRDADNLEEGKDVRVIACEDTYVYLGNMVDCLQVSNCVNCTIFVASVARVCTLDRCENVTLCVASNYLRIGNCVDCTVYSYTQLGSPVIYGDTRSLTMAPHNATYPALKQLLAAAEIVVPESMPSAASTAEQKRVNAIQQRLGHFSKPILMRVPK